MTGAAHNKTGFVKTDLKINALLFTEHIPGRKREEADPREALLEALALEVLQVDHREELRGRLAAFLDHRVLGAFLGHQVLAAWDRNRDRALRKEAFRNSRSFLHRLKKSKKNTFHTVITCFQKV